MEDLKPTRSKDIDDTANLDIIREILSWKWETDHMKRYYIQSFLLNWVRVEDIHRITESDKRACGIMI